MTSTRKPEQSNTVQPITDGLVKSLTVPVGKRKLIVYDAPAKLRDTTFVPGFGVRLTAGGARVFVLRYRADGVDRTMRIGPYGPWTVAAARERARELRQRVDQGQDPQRDKAADNAEQTLSQTFTAFIESHGAKLRPKSREGYKSTFDLHIAPVLGKRKTTKIEHDDIVELHSSLTRRSGPYTANRAIAILSRVFNLALRKSGGVNPAKGVERNQEIKRNRYLRSDEVARLLDALGKLRHRQSADAFRLLLLTGARKSEVLTATWDQFDLESGIWIKPGATTKQKTDHRAPLSAAAQRLVADMHARRTSDTWLFPAFGNEGHQDNLKSAWRSIRKLANLPDVRIHDLRHSYASFLASGGASLPIIGALLGHTQAATTARYAHLLDDPLKTATDKVGALVTGIESGKRAGVVKLKGSRRA